MLHERKIGRGIDRRRRFSLEYELRDCPSAFIDSINTARIESGLKPLKVRGIPDHMCSDSQRAENEKCRLDEKLQLLKKEHEAILLSMKARNANA